MQCPQFKQERLLLNGKLDKDHRKFEYKEILHLIWDCVYIFRKIIDFVGDFTQT